VRIIAVLPVALLALPTTGRAAILVAGSGNPAKGTSPFFESLGAVTVTDAVLAADVSGSGAVVACGEGTADAQGNPIQQEACFWDATHGLVVLGALNGFAHSAAHDVSEDGRVVAGESYTAGQANEATVWSLQSPTGPKPVGLGFLPGTQFSTAHAVSGDGSVVVGGSFSVDAQSYITEDAFIWDATHGMRGLGLLPGESSSVANGVSADGSVVVGESASFNTPTTLSTEEAFAWTSAGGMVGLGFLAGDTLSRATAVSADGSFIVGSSGARDDQGQVVSEQAFLWDATHGMVGLGVLDRGLRFSEALGVSANGAVVVGWGFDIDSQGLVQDPQAFIWDPQNGIQQLQYFLVLDGLGAAMNGWHLEQATGVSNDGRTIVGFAATVDAPRGWIAYLPEPARPSSEIAALMLLSALAWRRRSERELDTAARVAGESG